MLILRFAPILFLVNSLALGLLTPGYSPSSQTISSLVHEKFGTLQTTNFLICGLLTLLLAYFLKDQTYKINNAHLIPIGALVLGVSLVLLGLLPADKSGQTTLIGQLHGVVFISSVLAQISLQLAVALSNYPSKISAYLIASSVVTIFGLLGMWLMPDIRGIVQRILVAAIVIWVSTASFWARK